MKKYLYNLNSCNEGFLSFNKVVYRELKTSGLLEREYQQIIYETRTALNQIIEENNIDLVVIPQSSNKILRDILVGVDYIVLKKTNPELMKKKVQLLDIQKSQKQSLLKSLDANEIKISSFKGKQRDIIKDFLFEKVDAEKDNVLIFDDSSFSSSTLTALNNSVNAKSKLSFTIFGF